MSTWESRDKLKTHFRKHGEEVAAIRGSSSSFETKDYAASCNKTTKDAVIILEYEDTNHLPNGRMSYSNKFRSYFDSNSLLTVEVPHRKIYKTHFPNGCEGPVQCENLANQSKELKLEMYKHKITTRIDNRRYQSVNVIKSPKKWTLFPN